MTVDIGDEKKKGLLGTVGCAASGIKKEKGKKNLWATGGN